MSGAVTALLLLIAVSQVTLARRDAAARADLIRREQAEQVSALVSLSPTAVIVRLEEFDPKARGSNAETLGHMNLVTVDNLSRLPIYDVVAFGPHDSMGHPVGFIPANQSRTALIGWTRDDPELDVTKLIPCKVAFRDAAGRDWCRGEDGRLIDGADLPPFRVPQSWLGRHTPRQIWLAGRRRGL